MSSIIPAQAFPGMEYLPFMFLTTAVGGLAAVVGILAGLLTPTSRVARTAGWTAVGLGLVPTVLYIPLTLGDIFPIAYAITAWPAVLGAAAVGLSKRPRLRRERAIVITTALVAAGLVVSIAAVSLVSVRSVASGEERLRALLDGRPVSRLAGFEIEYQQRDVRCTDPAVLRYLEARLAQAEKTMSGGGTTYQLTLLFADGNTASVPTYWGDDEFSLSIGRRAVSEGWPTHRVDFAPPMPEAFRRMLDFLAAPYEKVAGQILEITPEGTTTGYDASLDLRGLQ